MKNRAAKHARTAPEKRSTKHFGIDFTFSLDKVFYEALQAIADRRGTSIGEVVARVDAERRDQGLSSALRLFILIDTQRQVIAANALIAVAAKLAPIDDWEDSPTIYAAEPEMAP